SQYACASSSMSIPWPCTASAVLRRGDREWTIAALGDLAVRVRAGIGSVDRANAAAVSRARAIQQVAARTYHPGAMSRLSARVAADDHLGEPRRPRRARAAGAPLGAGRALGALGALIALGPLRDLARGEVVGEQRRVLHLLSGHRVALDLRISDTVLRQLHRG